jgi:hypothetical protein
LNRYRAVRLSAMSIIALSIICGGGVASAATSSEFSAASSAIASSYTAVLNAQEKGGNVSGLVAQLQESVDLVQKATAENSANPTLASADLSNATSIAQMVSNEAPAAGLAGAEAKQVLLYTSVGSAAAIILVALLVYRYGDRIFRRAWLRVYGKHLVEKVG